MRVSCGKNEASCIAARVCIWQWHDAFSLIVSQREKSIWQMCANQQDKTLRRYLKPELLVIDDFGLKQLPKNSGEYLFEVIMRRYENRSTIMTSNRPLEEWGKLLGDVPTAGAILDRFLHHTQVVAITGRSYRLKDQSATSKKDKKNKSKSNEPLAAGAAT
jgi:DNA replication protein DnaC